MDLTGIHLNQLADTDLTGIPLNQLAGTDLIDVHLNPPADMVSYIPKLRIQLHKRMTERKDIVSFFR